jgi:hypothetical protein
MVKQLLALRASKILPGAEAQEKKKGASYAALRNSTKHVTPVNRRVAKG